MSSKTPAGNFMILADVDTLRHNIRSDQVVGTGLLYRSITPEPIVTVTVWPNKRGVMEGIPTSNHHQK